MTTNATPEPVEVKQADRLAALNHHGFKEEADLSYWGSGYDMRKVDETAQLLARHRTQALADAAAEAEPVGYIIAEMLNRKSEFQKNGIVMTAAPQGMSTLPLYAARPVQSELVEALEGLLKYEGHHVYCGHAPDYDQPCVCGFNEADAKARALVAKATGDGLS